MSDEVIYLVNPKPKRKRRSGTRRKRDSKGRFLKTARRTSTSRRRTRRRNPTGGSLMTVNPKRRRRRTTRRRRTYRRNPRRRGTLRSLVSLRGVTPVMVAWNVAGMIGTQSLTPAILKMVNQPETGPIGMVGKAVTAMLGAFAIDKFLKQKQAAQAFLQGGLISVATDLYNVYIKPRLGLGGMYEFESSFAPAGSMSGAYMYTPMDQALLGDGGGSCVPSGRYLSPIHQATVPAGPRMAEVNAFPERLTPTY